MEKQAVGVRGWQWQRSWSGVYCMAIEDPNDPGTLMQIVDPIIKPEPAKAKSRWGLLFSFSR